MHKPFNWPSLCRSRIRKLLLLFLIFFVQGKGKVSLLISPLPSLGHQACLVSNVGEPHCPRPCFMMEIENLSVEPYCSTLAFPRKREAHRGTILFPTLAFLTQVNGSHLTSSSPMGQGRMQLLNHVVQPRCSHARGRLSKEPYYSQPWCF